jgi:hypothetical protein
MKRCLLLPLVLLLSLPLPAQPPPAPPNPNIFLGLPAKADKDRKTYLIERPQYVLSYNSGTHAQLGLLAADQRGHRQGQARAVLARPAASPQHRQGHERRLRQFRI